VIIRTIEKLHVCARVCLATFSRDGGWMDFRTDHRREHRKANLLSQSPSYGVGCVDGFQRVVDVFEESRLTALRTRRRVNRRGFLSTTQV
jgi:hypothetical protein